MDKQKDDTIKIRKPDFSKLLTQPSGRVVRDELGNAVWSWSKRGQSAAVNLLGAALTLTEEPAEAARKAAAAPQIGGGYDPYGASAQAKRSVHVKSDLRSLSKAIEATRRAREAAADAATGRSATDRSED